jgi:hypothetical protein
MTAQLKNLEAQLLLDEPPQQAPDFAELFAVAEEA